MAEVAHGESLDPACECWRQPTNYVTKWAIVTPLRERADHLARRTVVGRYWRMDETYAGSEAGGSILGLGRRVRYRRRPVVKRITARMPWSSLLKNPIPSRQVELDRTRSRNRSAIPPRLVPH